MAIFDDKSVQGIIDKITAELTCIGSITDKSIQGIIDKATAAGITDKSIQGIIDKLTSFSCIPAAPVYTEFYDEYSCGTEISWAVPAGVTKLKVFCIGGGGGGAATHAAGCTMLCGGGGGGVWGGYVKLPDTVSDFKIIIGCGGTTNDQTLGTASYIKVNGVNYCTGNGGKVYYPGTGGGSLGGNGSTGFDMNASLAQTVGLTGGGGGSREFTSHMNADTSNYGGGGGGGAYNIGRGGSAAGTGGLDFDGVQRSGNGSFSVQWWGCHGGDGSRGGGGGLAAGGHPTSGGKGLTGGTGGKGVVRIYYGGEINAIPDEDCDLIIT